MVLMQAYKEKPGTGQGKTKRRGRRWVARQEHLSAKRHPRLSPGPEGPFWLLLQGPGWRSIHSSSSFQLRGMMQRAAGLQGEQGTAFLLQTQPSFLNSPAG